MFDINGKDNNTYNVDNFEFIKKTSPIVGGLIEKEYNRQKNNVELIASENYCSEAVLAACGSCLSWKYAEGYPYVRTSGNTSRYYGGTEFVDQLEEYCCDQWRKVFDTDYHVNVQPHSGSQANFAAYKAIHGSSVNFSGKLYNMVFYDVDEKGYIDMADVRKKALACRPKLILTGASAYSRTIDFAAFGEIAREVGAYFMVDMAHIAGLVAGGAHPSPFGHADIITTTTHKTLRGPRGGLIFARQELAKKIDSAVFPYAQGGPLEHIIAGKAVCAEEAQTPEYKEYVHQVVKNCKALSDEFIKLGYKVVTGGTDNHLMLCDVMSKGKTGMEVQELLDAANITANKNTIPFDTQSVKLTSGMRFGSPAATTRGMKEQEMHQIGAMIARLVNEGEEAVPQVKEQVIELCRQFPLYPEL